MPFYSRKIKSTMTPERAVSARTAPGEDLGQTPLRSFLFCEG
jgi:hypothetical protein